MGKNHGEERRNHYVEKDWYKTVVVSKKIREKEKIGNFFIKPKP